MEFALAILHMSREEAMWETSVVTLQRMQAAHLQRNGERVEWDPGRIDRLIEALEGSIGAKEDPASQDRV